MVLVRGVCFASYSPLLRRDDRLPDAHARTPRPVAERRDLRGLSLSPTDGFVLSRIDGTLTEHDLVAATGLTGEAVATSLATLEEPRCHHLRPRAARAVRVGHRTGRPRRPDRPAIVRQPSGRRSRPARVRGLRGALARSITGSARRVVADAGRGGRSRRAGRPRRRGEARRAVHLRAPRAPRPLRPPRYRPRGGPQGDQARLLRARRRGFTRTNTSARTSARSRRRWRPSSAA